MTFLAHLYVRWHWIGKIFNKLQTCWNQGNSLLLHQTKTKETPGLRPGDPLTKMPKYIPSSNKSQKKHHEHIKFQTLDIQIPTVLTFGVWGMILGPKHLLTPVLTTFVWHECDEPGHLLTPHLSGLHSLNSVSQLWASKKLWDFYKWKDPMFRQICSILENQCFFSKDPKMSQIVHLESQTWTTMICFVFPQQKQC